MPTTLLIKIRDRRCSLIAVFLLVALWGTTTDRATAAEPTTSPQRPNMLVIFSDDHVFGTMGCSGNKAIHTPHLDRLAATGLRFTTATVPSPVCVASRASILCSLYPQQHGSTFLNTQPFLQKVRETELKTLPQLFAEADYVTGHCGKTHMGNPRENLGFQYGQDYDKKHEQQIFACAENFLEKHGRAGQPFLLWVAPNRPHVPLRPPQKWLDFYKPENMPVAPNFMENPPTSSLVNQGKPGEIGHPWDKRIRPKTREEAQQVTAKYYGEISAMDEQIGNLLKKLADLGIEKNTIVIYLSDNGYHLGNHGLTNKLVMYEESIRVPFIIRYPSVIHAGQVSRELVSSLDLMPTLLDFAGLPVPEGLEGKSLKPLLTGQKTHLRNEVFSECCAVTGLGMGHRMVRTQQWKYMLSDVNEEGLFDLKNDPFEMNNLAQNSAAHQPLKQLRNKLANWMDRIGDTHERPPR